MHDEKAESLSGTYDRLIGSLFILGFEGTEITPQIRSLIEQHHVGSICISAKNLVGASMACQMSRTLVPVPTFRYCERVTDVA